MKRRIFLSKGTAGVIALGAVGCSNDDASNTLTPAFKTSITGNIFDSDGNGIQGVNIVITGNEIRQSVSTNEEGKFSIDVPKIGEYTLYPGKAGYTFKPKTQ